VVILWFPPTRSVLDDTTNKPGQIFVYPGGSSQTVSSDSSPLQSSGNSVSDAPNQYGFFFGAEEEGFEWQRQKPLSGKEGEESFSYPDLLFENMQLIYAAPPLLMQWLPRQGSELHHRPVWSRN